MESIRIVALCIIAACLYGIVHDQFTARICLEYFTIFHPPVFATRSPTLLGIGWGILATWWVGALLSIPLMIAARAGSRPSIPAARLVKPIATLLIVMAVCAAVVGLAGYILAAQGKIATDWLAATLLPSSARFRFMGVWWAHSASYASGIVGGALLCAITYRRRRRLPLLKN